MTNPAPMNEVRSRAVAGLASPAIVRAESLNKSYLSRTRDLILKSVSLEIAKGECVAIMGPSGCGKTTLLNCLSGLDRPDDGRVFFDNVDLTRATDHQRTALRARRMGFVFQGFNLVPVLSALANVRLHIEFAGTSRTDAARRARTALAAVGLQDLEDRRPAELSGGEQQRVAIARALVNDPAVVWADEPTGNLDSNTGRRILDLFGRLNRERGTTFLIVTHDPNVASIAHRVLRMDSGRIVRADEK